MRSILSYPPAFLALLLAAASTSVMAADPAEKTPTTTACTASTTAGSFFDLRPDIAKKGADTKHRRRGDAPHKDYHARGWDYGFNFTLNVCEPVVETPDNVRGLDRDSWQNISAYYVSKGDVYSLGAASGNLTTRGRKLVLQYTGGSPCGKSSAKRDDSGHLLGKRSSRHGGSYKDYSDDETATATSASLARSTKALAAATAKATDTTQRRKSATISFLCDRDPTATTAAVSFVGADPDECAYFFEMRSQHACAGAEPHAPGSVGPGYLFVIIIFIAILVYLGGGIMYQRTVANQRGWRQLPNYTLWSNIWSHISVCSPLARPSLGVLSI